MNIIYCIYSRTGLIAVIAVAVVFFCEAMAATSEKLPALFPSPEKPLLIDKKATEILLYTEISKEHLSKTSPHWGIVYRDGKMAAEAIFQSFASPTDFHDALVEIGAQPGNCLVSGRNGKTIAGDRLLVSAVWPGLKQELGLPEILSDAAGRGFDIRFGGNRDRALKEKTGCILCLESCPIAITSNASYSAVGMVQRIFSPNSHFRGRQKVLPNVDKHPVIFIFRLSVSQ